VTQLADPKWLQRGKELQFSGIKGLLEIINKQSAKQRRTGTGRK
jgi:hypothetical protein